MSRESSSSEPVPQTMRAGIEAVVPADRLAEPVAPPSG